MKGEKNTRPLLNDTPDVVNRVARLPNCSYWCWDQSCPRCQRAGQPAGGDARSAERMVGGRPELRWLRI